MLQKTLLENNIVLTLGERGTYHLHAVENPRFSVQCRPDEVDATAIRVAEQRGYQRGLSESRRQVVERLFGDRD